MYQTLLFFATLLVLIPTLYLCTVAIVTTRFPTIRNKRICLLIAHPDDEAMFFAPTLLALTRPEVGNHVTILCLSSGDAEGLGETRKRELVKSGLVLGLRREDIFVVDNPLDFPDSTTLWCTEKISSLLHKTFAPNFSSSASNPSSESSLSGPPKSIIDILITFDSRGVSSHPNHVSLFHGARAFVSRLTRKNPGWTSPINLYTLTSVSLLRKYTGMFDALATLGATTLAMWRGGAGGKGRRKVGNRKHPPDLVFMHGFGERGWVTAREAMTSAHVSQMIWFRYGWITLSRYMFMNDLRLDSI